MKLNIAILLAAVQAAGVFSVAVPNPADAQVSAAEECGDLGVMRSFRSEELPNGIKSEEIRKCSNHPLGKDRHLDRASLAPMEADEREPYEKNFSPNNPQDTGIDALEKRDCYTDAPYGCSDGYCWKTCGGGGEWCWTASNGGFGSWFTCKTHSDCGQLTYACGRGFCDDCGCSC